MPDCLFCKIIAGEIPCEKIYENEYVMAFLDIRPVNPGHTLVIPKQHSANLLEMSKEDLDEVMRVIKKITPVLLKAVGATGFNLGLNTGKEAGQVIFHTHFHIMPRFEGDGYELWHGKSINTQSFVQLGEKIRGCFDEID
ncbi:diadenosine tetraphosphate hydrolase [Candidatus Uhrbacteria bacterium CG_4_9_14_3_um_filter_36_7]|uniref:Diadenosine tetraphosphate hydrolase n=1 Tax=Candidatus Uhrbacteria bacterium CG_4_9_14_3_um_filter_36_7 TaxID=1975033 RepID=A0A2M7XI20_9BACT|nr:MAG: diadenosine tetraphosphate hydrolase [Candidatus Uhrbacteria bacterium CG_4_9_14_3_um_filter_36_7]